MIFAMYFIFTKKEKWLYQIIIRPLFKNLTSFISTKQREKNNFFAYQARGSRSL